MKIGWWRKLQPMSGNVGQCLFIENGRPRRGTWKHEKKRSLEVVTDI
jgi:hypothetical protein